MEKFIPKSALVEALGISTRTLENWIAQRGFPAPRHISGSRLVFFHVADVEAWLEDELGAGERA
ncbi:MAG: helix-turn-helix domain-containing protein [Burkholderiaceae bacterium]|nr:helix-turn-helix domain-containing protein [Burkholderiaceae bacterium]